MPFSVILTTPEYVNTEHFVQEGGSWSEIPDYKPVNNID